MTRKLIVYIACSLDGYIAAPNDDLSFLDAVTREGEDYGYAEFYKTVDTVIMGRKTYDWVQKQVPNYHSEKQMFIITRNPKVSDGNISYYDGSLHQLVMQLKTRAGKNIFCDGGAEVVHSLLLDNLVDEFIISIIPVLLGNGIRLFKDGRDTQKLTLLSSQSFPSGLIQLHYKNN